MSSGMEMNIQTIVIQSLYKRLVVWYLSRLSST